MFGDKELIEPNTVFGPNVAKAMGLFGELWGATVILYELAPDTLVHLRIMVLDVAENTDTWIANGTNKMGEDNYHLSTVNMDSFTQKCVFKVLYPSFLLMTVRLNSTVN